MVCCTINQSRTCWGRFIAYTGGVLQRQRGNVLDRYISAGWSGPRNYPTETLEDIEEKMNLYSKQPLPVEFTFEWDYCIKQMNWWVEGY